MTRCNRSQSRLFLAHQQTDYEELSEKHTASFALDREYMSEGFDQFRRFGSRWRVAEWVIGVAFILAGFALFNYTDWAIATPVALVVIGIVEILSSRIKKFFWLRKHAKSKASGVKIEMTFDEEGIESKTDASVSRLDWSAVEKCVRTPRGILLWPQEEIYVWIPESVFGIDAINFVESRVS